MPDEATAGEESTPVLRTLADKVNWLIDRAHPAGRGPFSNNEIAVLIKDAPGEVVVAAEGRHHGCRNYVTGRYWISLDRWHYLYKKIDIKGLGFFDDEHGVTGAAPNKIELHPVIYIRCADPASAIRRQAVYGRLQVSGARPLVRPPGFSL